MNGLERVVAVMEGRQPDRVPLGFYLADCDIIGHVIGRKTYARDKIGQQVALWEGRRDEIVASLMGDVIDFYRKIDLCDVLTHKEAILPSANYQPQKVERLADDVWRDEQGRVYKVSELSNEFVCVEDPTGDAEREFRPEDFPEDDVPGEVDETEFAAFDRLIAELGGCFLASELGLPTAERLENHVSYMKTWLKNMQDDPRFIFKAAAQAAKAADFILAFSREPVEEPEEVMA